MAQPEQMTRLYGRDEMIAELSDLLRYERDERLVTLWGPGGVGKTRLAIRVMNEVAEDFGGDIGFVDLARLVDYRDLPAAIARVLNLSFTDAEGTEARLLEEIAARELLLVLDNFEHVREAESFVSQLLQRCQNLIVLVTSREPLRVAGQRLLEVKPLAIPASRPGPNADEYQAYPVVQLFVDRARRARPGFTFSDENIEDILEICRLLSGLPLAIELAAARLRYMSTRELKRGLAGSLDLLTTGPMSSPERHRSLRSTLAWSFALLEPAEQRLMPMLSTFITGFTSESAHALAREASPEDRLTSDLLPAISSLVDKSLLTAEVDDAATTRFTFLEPIRQFGLDMLRQSENHDRFRDAHARVFLALSEEAFLHLRDGDPLPWLNRLERDLPDMQEALAWTTRHEGNGGELGLRIANAMWLFWRLRGYYGEALTWLERALDAAGNEPSSARADALILLGHTIQDNDQRSRACYEEARTIYRTLGNKRGEAGALTCLGVVAEHAGEYALALRYHQESLSLFQKHGDPGDRAHAEHQLGSVAATLGDLRLATTHFEHARDAFHRLGRKTELAYTLLELGRLAGLDGRGVEAEDILLWSLNVFQKTAVADGETRALFELGVLALERRELDTAAERFRQMLGLYETRGSYDEWVAMAIEGLAELALVSDDAARAVRLMASADYWRKSAGRKPKPAHERTLNRLRARARRSLSEREFTSAWRTGHFLLTIAGAIQEATSIQATSTVRPSAPQTTPPGTNVKLTPTQRIVLCHVADGKSNQEIAGEMGVTLRTATTHIGAILQRLDVKNRAGAAAFAVRHNLCPPGS